MRRNLALTLLTLVLVSASAPVAALAQDSGEKPSSWVMMPAAFTCSSMPWSIVARRPAAKIATSTTSATPEEAVARQTSVCRTRPSVPMPSSVRTATSALAQDADRRESKHERSDDRARPPQCLLTVRHVAGSDQRDAQAVQPVVQQSEQQEHVEQ